MAGRSHSTRHALLGLLVIMLGCNTATPGSGLPTFASPRLTSPPTIDHSVPPSGPATPGPTTSASPSAAASPLVIEVALTDALRIDPAAVSVPAGVPVTFRVTNAGALAHEFFLGDATAQDQHETEMQAAGGEATHDGPMGIGVAPGDTEELTFTFPTAGEWLAGCHVTSHYAGGMRARIEVRP